MFCSTTTMTRKGPRSEAGTPSSASGTALTITLSPRTRLRCVNVLGQGGQNLQPTPSFHPAWQSRDSFPPVPSSHQGMVSSA